VNVSRFPEMLQALVEAGVQFIVVGGVAATIHGSARLTQDLDIVYSRKSENVDRVVDALRPFHPYLRGAPQGLPFVFDARTLKSGLNFTLVTDLGWIDLLGEVTGGGDYERLLPHATEVSLFGVRIKVLDVDKLIEVKRAAGRPKDFEAIAELEAIRDESKG
jgi:predicted nucleotidyltransferase